ncbi:hypothetical protein [Mameliella alba]|uniref:Uncharacterized protein n=1 Tax=Mameliella alba TaxID=561184 RepID=A0A0B3S0N5_9RHOB|nr:hypothetical protein [Mameliella alba]KHQ50146.1 hypothetical protein OA50_05265 [Mameliella alba]
MSIQSNPTKKTWTSPVLKTTRAAAGSGSIIDPVELLGATGPGS